MILLIDHNDSFVHVLASYVRQIGADATVLRADTLSVTAVRELSPARILLSPGPGRPADYPLTLDIIRLLGEFTPTLGVCLGHQCIATAFGARVSRAAHPRHGMTSSISHDGAGIFQGISSPFMATRYHSLSVAEASVPDVLQVTATADDGEIMGIRHRTWPVEGVQFHPESVLTEHGLLMIKNFVAEG